MKKSAKIILIALAAIVLAGAIGFMILYIKCNAVRFDYVRAQYGIGENEDIVMYVPFFANKMLLGEYGGAGYASPFELGLKNIPVYAEVNGPIHEYAVWTAQQYKNGIMQLTDYEVENDGKTLTVKLFGSGDNGEGAEPIEKVFIFDIENASLDNLPTWTNRTEADNEYYPW